MTICAELPPERYSNIALPRSAPTRHYVGSFSKTIAPNLRVGYLVADKDRAQQLAALKNTTSLSSSELMENIVLSILTAGRHRTHLERLRRRIGKRARACDAATDRVVAWRSPSAERVRSCGPITLRRSTHRACSALPNPKESYSRLGTCSGRTAVTRAITD